MLTPNDIADTLARMIGEVFPGEQVYRDKTENGFQRPCNLVEFMGGKVFLEGGRYFVELQDKFTITTFVEVDEYANSHFAALHLRQMKLVGMLLPGFIRVEDRAPKVIALERDGGLDYDTVTVTFSYMLNREEFMNLEQLPVMEQLHLTKEVTTHG